MKIRILNGEKVCTVQDDLNQSISVYPYRDIVKSINKIFKEAELSESIKNCSSDPMSVVLIVLAEAYDLPVKKIDIREKEIIFDDEKGFHKSKKKRFNFTKPAPLKGLRIIQGGKM